MAIGLLTLKLSLATVDVCAGEHLRFLKNANILVYAIYLVRVSFQYHV